MKQEKLTTNADIRHYGPRRISVHHVMLNRLSSVPNNFTITKPRDKARKYIISVRGLPFGRPFSCSYIVIVIECPRIGRTRLVGVENFLKIKYGVTTLQKRAISHNRPFVDHGMYAILHYSFPFQGAVKFSEVLRRCSPIHTDRTILIVRP